VAIWSSLGVMAIGASLTWMFGNPLTMLLLIPPGVACGLALRGFHAQRKQRGQLDHLSAALQETTSANALERGVKQLLVAATRLFKAEYAEILRGGHFTSGRRFAQGIAGTDMGTDRDHVAADPRRRRARGSSRGAIW